MSDFMSTVSSRIQRVKIEAISDQILPQIQVTLKTGRGQICLKGDGRTWPEDRSTGPKKAWTVGLGVTPGVSATGLQREMKTLRVLI